MKRLIKFTLLVVLIALLAFGENNKSEVTICFTGDILLDRGVKREIEKNSYDYPYLLVRDLMKKSDIVYGNLECPLINESTPVLKRRDLVFKGDLSNAKALKNAGYTILNLANNHTMDYGHEGLLSTLNVLKKESIKTIGAGYKKEDAYKPVYIYKNGIKTGFLSYSIFPPEGYIYSNSKPDIARFENWVNNDIKKVKKKCDFLVLTFHWGKEFAFFSSELQKEFAHNAIDSGCDVVVGHHPHVLQEIEIYKDKPIFYSIGNFVFDNQIPQGTDETIILNLKLKRSSNIETEIIPIKIKNCQPTPIYGTEAEYILKRLRH